MTRFIEFIAILALAGTLAAGERRIVMDILERAEGGLHRVPVR